MEVCRCSESEQSQSIKHRNEIKAHTLVWIKDENEEIKRQQRWKIHSWNANWVHLQPNIRNLHLTEAEHNRFNKKHPPQRQNRKQDGPLYRGVAERVSDHSAFHRGRGYWLSVFTLSRKSIIISIEIKLWWGTPSLNSVLSERMEKKKSF